MSKQCKALDATMNMSKQCKAYAQAAQGTGVTITISKQCKGLGVGLGHTRRLVCARRRRDTRLAPALDIEGLSNVLVLGRVLQCRVRRGRFLEPARCLTVRV
jgi:hypothetical protein